jgi:two-component system phosphate regulon sensor histidine kinase PhoR
MASIVENLLKLARFDAQEMHFEPARFGLHDCLKTLLDQVEKLADSRHVVLDLSCPADLELTADRFKLEQALLNLLDNAIKYALPQTLVTLTGQCDDNQIVLRVHDRGSVIPKEELPQVFDRFWRSRSTMREKGYGLGLSIVKALVEMHSGSVGVTSTEESGTEFVIRLPQETAVEPAARG